jgi:hypothetical protein
MRTDPRGQGGDMTTRELLQMALDAIDERRSLSGETAKEYYVAHQIRAHLAKPEPEPVAWEDNLGNLTRYKSKYAMRPLYTKDQL